MIVDPNETLAERFRHSFKSIGSLGVALVFSNAIGFVFGLLTQTVIAFGKGTSSTVSYNENPIAFIIMSIHFSFIVWFLAKLTKPSS
jgi:hypothetical protein